MEKSTTLTKASQALSFALHPLVLPTLGVMLLVFGDSILSSIPPSIKWFFVGAVFMNTFVIPSFSVGLLHTFKIIPDLSLSNPKYRLIVMAVIGVSYAMCLMMLSNLIVAFMIKRFIYAALATLIATAVVTYFWKVSLHMAAMGSMLSMILILNVSGFSQSYSFTLLFILLCGLLASARLCLGRHNWLQIAAGFFCGFTISALTLLFA